MTQPRYYSATSVLLIRSRTMTQPRYYTATSVLLIHGEER
jgi:hypothetical protein